MSDRSSQNFDLDGALDRLAARVCREIKSKRRRERAIKEFRGHLEDAAEDIMRQGNPPEVAYAELEESLGDTDKLSTLMASVHNTHRFSLQYLLLLPIIIYIGYLIFCYITIDDAFIREGIAFQLQWVALITTVALALVAGIWFRAISRRASGLRRLRQCVAQKGGEISCCGNGYHSLFTRSDVPELIVDVDKRRYILYLWATVLPFRMLHLQDNGIYSYNKNFTYMLVMPDNAPGSRLEIFRPKGMENEPMFSWYYTETIQLPAGAHLMPQIDYSEFYDPNRINIPVFLLNPIPLSVEICENGSVHKLGDGDKLPKSMGGATVYSMASFISMLERDEPIVFKKGSIS